MKILHRLRRPDRAARAAEPRRGMMKMALSSDPGLLCAVRGAVERLTESIGFPEEDSRAITRAVDEALTNIIRHSYNGRADQPIELYFSTVARENGETNGLEILLCDQGPPVNKDKWCRRALEEVRPGGLGLHFIEESMDVVEYTRARGTNRLRLVKYVPAKVMQKTEGV